VQVTLSVIECAGDVVLAHVRVFKGLFWLKFLLSHEHMLLCQSHLTHFSTTTRYRDIPSLNNIYISPQAININSVF